MFPMREHKIFYAREANKVLYIYVYAPQGQQAHSPGQSEAAPRECVMQKPAP